LYFSYPVDISGVKVWVPHGEKVIDGFSGATPLGVVADAKTGTAAQALQAATDHFGNLSYSMSDMFYGNIPGSIGETSTLACLIGAVILLICGVASWRVMGSLVVGAVVTALALNQIHGEGLPTMLSVTPQEHLVMGGLAFGAVFMATDPVSASRTGTGKYIYGFMIGMLTILIRCWNPAYPEGAMLAILFMNIFAPLIDHFVVRSNIKRRLSRVAA
jgi:Na+-transporting NADH:ubiquinone oxidoreductase subunit B